MTAAIARILFVLARLFGRLPWSWTSRLGDGVAWLWRRQGRRESKVAWRNLELAYPDASVAEREAMHAAILRTTARQAFGIHSAA